MGNQYENIHDVCVVLGAAPPNLFAGKSIASPAISLPKGIVTDKIHEDALSVFPYHNKQSIVSRYGEH